VKLGADEAVTTLETEVWSQFVTRLTKTQTLDSIIGWLANELRQVFLKRNLNYNVVKDWKHHS
jgi:hypothetical protein